MFHLIKFKQVPSPNNLQAAGSQLVAHALWFLLSLSLWLPRKLIMSEAEL